MQNSSGRNKVANGFVQSNGLYFACHTDSGCLTASLFLRFDIAHTRRDLSFPTTVFLQVFIFDVGIHRMSELIILSNRKDFALGVSLHFPLMNFRRKIESV